MPPLTAPRLQDGVVTLRSHHESDVEGVLEQCRDPLSIRWTTVPLGYTRDDARRFVRQVMPGGWATDQEWGFALVAPDREGEQRFAGTVSLRNLGSGRAEIAYGAHPGARGRGVVERGLRLLLAWGFAERDLGTVIWYADVGNWASRRLAWRLGFSFDGTLRGWNATREELRDAWVGTLRHDDEQAPRHRWNEVPRVVGERVVLRRHREEDWPQVQQACDDVETSTWLAQLPRPYEESAARRFLADREEGMATGRAVHWMVADPATDLCLGTVSLMDLEHGWQAEVGYWSHPAARGRGLMTEAVHLAARHAFVPREDGGLGLEKLRAVVAEDNVASLAVLERVGFRRAGVERGGIMLRDRLADVVGHDLLAPELPALPGRPAAP